MTKETPHFCILIAAYNESERIADVVKRASTHCPYVIVIDDGSKDNTSEIAAQAGADVITLKHNRGKGAALNAGILRAIEQHADFIITLDADGQHDPDEIPTFLEAYHRTAIPVLIGNRMADSKTMPIVRYVTNRIMSWLISKNMGQYIPDTQCGYRLFRSDILPFLTTKSERFAAESEILLRLGARNIRMDSVRIKTIYNESGHSSNINPLIDTARFFTMLHRHNKQQKCKTKECLNDKNRNK